MGEGVGVKPGVGRAGCDEGSSSPCFPFPAISPIPGASQDPGKAADLGKVRCKGKKMGGAWVLGQGVLKGC